MRLAPYVLRDLEVQVLDAVILEVAVVADITLVVLQDQALLVVVHLFQEETVEDSLTILLGHQVDSEEEVQLMGMHWEVEVEVAFVEGLEDLTMVAVLLGYHITQEIINLIKLDSIRDMDMLMLF